MIALQLSVWKSVSNCVKEYNLCITTSDVNGKFLKGKQAIGYFLETR